MSAEQAITEEVIIMISDESRRKLRELSLEPLIEALDHQELHIKEYSSMPFDQSIMLQLSRQNQTMILMNQILVIHKLLGWPFKANPMQRLLQLLQALPDNSFHPV